ncbi:MAG: hypothetical protein P4M08_10185 [Oligoflexia bacterium]|nr:hypothetical protein [Oligoflexia bacterium]
MRLVFDFYGVSVCVQSATAEFEPILADLRADFEFFHRPVKKVDDSPIKVKILLMPKSKAARACLAAPYVFKTRECRVYGWGPLRACNFPDGLTVITRSRFRRGRRLRTFWVLDPGSSLVYEAAYVAILSAVGEELDALGYHRIHALAFRRAGVAAVLPLPSRGGKSSIASLMIDDPETQLYSDEIPLLKKGRLYPFPVRIALFPDVARKLGLEVSTTRRFPRRIYPEKILFPIPQSRVAPAAPLGRLFYPAGTSFFAVRFVFNVVFGLGTPQMAQYMLRIDNFPRLARIAFSRFWTAVSIIARKTECRPVRLTGSVSQDKASLDRFSEPPASEPDSRHERRP